MRTIIIVQARMTSTRLPGKVMKAVLGKPLLEYLIERLQQVRQADAIVVATTTNSEDLPVVELCRRLGVPVTRGSEHDVLARYHDAAGQYSADIVVRVTADCPLIDPILVDEAISFYRGAPRRYDYVSNAVVETYPYGMAVEVFSRRVLDEAHREARTDAEREHVTPFFYTRPERYRVGHLVNAENLSRHRWTVDTQEDFDLVSKIMETLYPRNPGFRMDDVLALLEEHPEWSLINAHVVQKKLGE